MTLRDEQGEIEIGVGDLFEVKDAIFSVICPEVTLGSSPIWVRLYSGVYELEDGTRYEIQPDIHAPVLLFTAESVARCIRATRGADKPQQPLDSGVSATVPPKVVANTSRGRAGKKDGKQRESASGSLF